MDQGLWSNLPEDVMDRILAWLPVASFFRFRTVCKRWSYIMFSSSFLSVCSHVPAQSPYFLKIANFENSMILSSFDPSVNKWHNIPIDFLPYHAGYPVAAARGLLCFINKIRGYMDDYTSLFICNPLTKHWRELPPMLSKQRPILVSMVVDKTTKAYKVIVAGQVSTEVFDSSSSTWKKSGSLPRGEEISRNIAYCNGQVYCLAPRWYNCILLSYNVEQEVWARVKTGRLPGYCQFRHLVECKGHLVIVGKSVRHQILTICIWLLEQRTMKWREVGRMPQWMSDLFLRRPSESFYCSGHGDLIFLTRDNYEQGLLCDLTQKSWRWVPSCPNFDALAFEPRLDAVV